MSDADCTPGRESRNVAASYNISVVNCYCHANKYNVRMTNDVQSTLDGEVMSINLYRELSMPTTSMGLLRAEMSVNPTMSLKKTVTTSYCSALTSPSLTLTSQCSALT